MCGVGGGVTRRNHNSRRLGLWDQQLDGGGGEGQLFLTRKLRTARKERLAIVPLPQFILPHDVPKALRMYNPCVHKSNLRREARSIS